MYCGLNISRMCLRVCFWVRKLPPGPTALITSRARFSSSTTMPCIILRTMSKISQSISISAYDQMRLPCRKPAPSSMSDMTTLAIKVDRLLSTPACQLGCLAPVANEPIDSGML